MIRIIFGGLLSLSLFFVPMAGMSQEKIAFGAAFKGNPRYDLLSYVAENEGFWKKYNLKVEWYP